MSGFDQDNTTRQLQKISRNRSEPCKIVSIYRKKSVCFFQKARVCEYLKKKALRRTIYI